MSTSKRSAPRRKVVSVARSGSWGNVQWVHSLECGHTDSRKRLTPEGEQVGCVKCVLAEQFRNELSTEVDTPDLNDVDSIAAEIASIEDSVARTKAALAAKLGTIPDSVDVVWAAGELKFVVVMLTANEVVTLLQQ